MKNIFKKISPRLKNKMKNCQLLVLDFDGVLTENGVWVDEKGVESVRCDRGDGFGLEVLRQSTDVEVLILSAELNSVVVARAKKLKVDAIQTGHQKAEALAIELKSRGVTPKNVCYVGNDLCDIECMKKVGFAVAVADAYPQVKKVAGYITLARGGRGAVRELCELILYAKKGHPYP